MQKYFNFNPHEFDKNGDNVISGEYFLYYLEEWEKQFHDMYKPYFATHFFGDFTALSLIDVCLNIPKNEKCGMDLIEGEINVEVNWEIEKYSKHKTVYAISSRALGNEDEPLFLVKNPSLKNGKVLLKYIPDSDNDDEVIVPNPEFVDKKVKV